MTDLLTAREDWLRESSKNSKIVNDVIVNNNRTQRIPDNGYVFPKNYSYNIPTPQRANQMPSPEELSLQSGFEAQLLKNKNYKMSPEQEALRQGYDAFKAEAAQAYQDQQDLLGDIKFKPQAGDQQTIDNLLSPERKSAVTQLKKVQNPSSLLDRFDRMGTPNNPRWKEAGASTVPTGESMFDKFTKYGNNMLDKFDKMGTPNNSRWKPISESKPMKDLVDGKQPTIKDMEKASQERGNGDVGIPALLDRENPERVKNKPLPFGGNTDEAIKYAVDEVMPDVPPQEKAKVITETQETRQEVNDAANDPSMWEQFLYKLGFGEEVANKAWEGAQGIAGRIDWLTMAVVTAASVGSGNNVTKAIANGLLRGMEAQSIADQQAAAQAQAAQENQLKRADALDESTRKWYEAETGRINAQNTGDYYKGKLEQGGEGDEVLDPTVAKWTMPEVDAQVNEFLSNNDLDKGFPIFGRSQQEAGKIKALVKNGVVQALNAGDTRDVSAIAMEILKQEQAKQEAKKEK